VPVVCAMLHLGYSHFGGVLDCDRRTDTGPQKIPHCQLRTLRRKN